MNDYNEAIRLAVNGQMHDLIAPSRVTLADALRDALGYTGTNVGCEQGICGACTVLVDGLAVRSCLIFAVQVDKRSITTIEGLESHQRLHPLQEMFLEARALQCGFCTPGFLMYLVSIQQAIAKDELAEALSGHICRCTGYRPIIRVAEAWLRRQGLLAEG